MKLLTQNSKMRKSSKNGIAVFNWTLPAGKTCPNAGTCLAGCYARSGTYMFSASKKAHEAKFMLTRSNDFIGLMVADIESKLKRNKHVKVRIHDAGDFYSESYTQKWFSIMNHFSLDTRVSFYAYTKQVALFKAHKSMGNIPANFTIIFSLGGKQDNLIDQTIDRHSKVFETIELLTNAGYSEGTSDDMVAAMGINNKIGLVFHHAKNWSNTEWDKVA